MFGLRSIECCGCVGNGRIQSFFDDDKHRPVFIPCGHSICSTCVGKCSECPICEEKIVSMENYAARVIFEDFKKNPLTLFKSWFKAEPDGFESCSKCREPSKKLFQCITCTLKSNHFYIEYVENDGTPWDDFSKQIVAEVRKKQKEKMEKAVIINNFVRYRSYQNDEFYWKPRFRMLFNALSNSVFCSDCIIENHNEHIRKTLLQLEYSIEYLKSSSSQIASGFLWNELKTKKGKCLIRTMRLHRICEKLVHLARFYYPSQNAKIEYQDYHGLFPTRLNKFFESFSRKNLDGIPMEKGDKWIQLLENQLKQLENQKKCECELVWNEMHKMSFGNQIEKKFIQIINDLEDSEITECPLKHNEIIPIRNQAIEMSKTKLFKLYTVFCWDSTISGVCCLFDDSERKPLICPKCGVSTCMSCVKNISCKCSSCGNPFHDEGINVTSKLQIDHDLLELVDFYKNNCVDLLEKWWNCETSKLEFCLSCSSYSNELEICVFCEIGSTKNVLMTKPRIETRVEYRRNMKLYFKNSKLETFPIRWQCSDCKLRLQSNWIHKYCEESREKECIGKWSRGCNYLYSRVYTTKKCSSIDINGDKCEYNAIRLKDIEYYDEAMKSATSQLVLILLKTGIEEKVKCRLRKTKFLNFYGILKSEINYYLRKSMSDKKPEGLEIIASKIQNLIGILKKEWSVYQKEKETNCACSEILDQMKNDEKKRLKEKLNSQMNEFSDKCPLDGFSKRDSDETMDSSNDFSLNLLFNT